MATELKVYTQDEILDSSIGDDVYLQPDVDKVINELKRKDGILCSTIKCILYRDLMKDCPEKESLKKLAAETKWFE